MTTPWLRVTSVTVARDGVAYLATHLPGWNLVPSPVAAAARGAASRTILVVDDEEVVRAFITRALADAGYAVVEAGHGAAALALLEAGTHQLDLVLCDLVMPGLNGRDLARWLTAHRPNLPILLVSGYPLPYLEAHELYDAALPLLRKPFLPSRLLEAVEDTLAAAGPRSPSST